jgi:hypothetical protein
MPHYNEWTEKERILELLNECGKVIAEPKQITLTSVENG